MVLRKFDVDAALDEVDRAIKDLKFRGVQIYTPIIDKPLDSPEFMPLYEKMCQYNLPIWLHPQRGIEYPDYKSEKTSQYHIFGILGWVYETSTAMMRLVLSGTMEKYPGLKFITHHAGAMIPFLEMRLAEWLDGYNMLFGRTDIENLRKPAVDYFKMFYADTALCGDVPALMCGYTFFGAEHMLFGTDYPYDLEGGDKYISRTIDAVYRMDISDADKEMIFEGNAKRILSLNVKG